MSLVTKAPCGQLVEGQAAGRTRGVSRDYPQKEYHCGGRGARGEPVFARTARGWRPIGYIMERNGVNTFGKDVHSKRHRLRKPEGYALETAVIGELRQRGVSLVEVRERDTGETLRATLDAFDRHGVRIARGGFAPQVVLPMARWSAEPECQGRLFEAAT